MNIKYLWIMLLAGIYKITSEKTEIVCRLHTKILACPDGQGIFVSHVNYGRTETIACNQMVSFTTPCLSGPYTFSFVQYKCLGRKTCTIIGSHHSYENNCPTMNKYLNVTYSCLAANQFQSIDSKATAPTVLPLGSMHILTTPNYPRDYPSNANYNVSYQTGNNATVVEVEILDMQIRKHPHSNTCQDYLKIKGKGCRDIMTDNKLLKDSSVTLISTDGTDAHQCNGDFDVAALRMTTISLGATWNMTCVNSSLLINLNDDSLKRRSITLSRVSFQLSPRNSNSVQSIIVSLTDPWGETERHILSSADFWTVYLLPDRPETTSITVQLFGNSADVIRMKMQLYGCANNDIPSYSIDEVNGICSNQVWEHRHKVYSFWGPTVELQFQSDTWNAARGFMVKISARNPWIENRTIETTLPSKPPTLLDSTTQLETTSQLEASTIKPTTHQVSSEPNHSSSIVDTTTHYETTVNYYNNDWTFLEMYSYDTPINVKQPTLIHFERSTIKTSGFTVSHSGVYMIVSHVYCNQTDTTIILTVENNDTTHYDIAWTNKDAKTVERSSSRGIQNTMLIQLQVNDQITVKIVSGGLSIKQTPINSLASNNYSVKLSMAKL